MNITTIKPLIILSAISGAILGILTLIPYLGQIAFLITMCFISVPIIILMQKLELIDIKSNKQSILTGAIIGFMSFLTFCAIYLPTVYILGRTFNLYSLYGVSLFLNVGSFGIITLLVLFMAILSATINAFVGFLTYYGIDFFKNNK